MKLCSYILEVEGGLLYCRSKSRGSGSISITLPYLTSVSSTPFQGEPTVYVEQCLYLQCCALPPPLSITTNYKILRTLILST